MGAAKVLDPIEKYHCESHDINNSNHDALKYIYNTEQTWTIFCFEIDEICASHHSNVLL